ncbi:MAG: PTS sugar transporter subunit IIA [Phycisphaerales bacterium]|nr:MAG: PTS sugar transporter subunit IIA [Phycisphaerales bacterium]
MTEILREDIIKVNLDATNKWEAIRELVDLLISAHELRLTDRNEIIEGVFARERSLSTGLEHGIAVPHAVEDCVEDVIAALGTSQAGIPFESHDGQPAKLIILLLIPQGAFQRHVRTLAGIARLGTNPELRNQLFDAKTPAEVMDVLVRADALNTQ